MSSRPQPFGRDHILRSRKVLSLFIKQNICVYLCIIFNSPQYKIHTVPLFQKNSANFRIINILGVQLMQPCSVRKFSDN
jgi:hypothetical protein